MENPDRTFDVRVVDRMMRAGVVTQEQYAAWLESIEDSASECETSNVHMVFSRLPGHKDLDGVGDDDGDVEAG